MGNGNGIQLTFNFNKGVTPSEIAQELRDQADLFSPAGSDVDAPEAPAESEDDDFEAPKKKSPGRPKKTESFDDEDGDDADSEAEEEPPAPAKKAKPPTKDEVNDACKAHAKRHSFEETKALLQKKFKTTSVGKLDPSQYAAVIAAMKG